MIQAVALFSVFGLGIAFAIIGAVKLELAKRLGIDDAKVGGLISALMFTCIFMVLIIGPLVDAIGYQPVAIAGFILAGACIFLLAAAKTYKAALTACVLLGVGAMCMNTVGNTLVPQVFFEGNPAAALNLGNTFFGFGAFIAPLVIGLLLKRLGYSSTVSIIGVILTLPVILAIAASYPVIPSGFSLGRAFGLLGNEFVLLVSLALFCYISLEVSMGGWITTYLSSLEFTPERANATLSGFWVGMMVSRLLSSTFVSPENGPTVIALLAVVAAVTITVMVVGKSKPIAALVVVLTGLAFGPIFPTLIGVAFSNVVPDLQGSAFGIMFAIGLLGGSTVPAAIGKYSTGKTIQKALVIAVAASVILFLLAIILGFMG